MGAAINFRRYGIINNAVTTGRHYLLNTDFAVIYSLATAQSQLLRFRSKRLNYRFVTD
jgi:hypothetical protein